MGDQFVREVLGLCLQRLAIEEATNSELEFIEVVKNFEVARKKWLHAELELKKQKELLVKSDVARGALEVKLKHARNQLDVEIKKRYKAEADYQCLERQMQLICDVLVHDSKSSACLNDEQRSMLTSFSHKGASVPQHRGRRLSVIDESSFLSHSDISYDRTDDDLDLDSTTFVKPLKSRARERRRSSMGPSVGPPISKRGRVSGRSGDLLGTRPLEKEIETTVVKASVTTPETGGQIHMVIDITQETPEHPSRALRNEHFPSVDEQTSVWAHSEVTEAETLVEMEVIAPEPAVPQDFTPTVDKTLQHVFQQKTVIRPETCVPCGKRIRFGKMAVKCRDCRVVSHPECKQLCLEKCSPNAHGSAQPKEETLESFAPSTRPRIPSLIVQCVHEIERRGLEEKGIYRVPGGERLVKELREKYMCGKGTLMLHKVEEVHAVCGLLKDFLRKLKEPLITFKLHRTFMEASEMADEDKSVETLIKNIKELPQPNKDTLAFLMLHLQRVMQSPLCQMDQNNLSRVFGPTIIGHGMLEPSPMTIMRDTNTQPKVVARLLSFPSDFWEGFLAEEKDPLVPPVVDSNVGNVCPSTSRDKIFKPLTSPELSKYSKTTSGGSIKGRIKHFGGTFNNPSKPRNEPGKKKFFTSPK
ncbi:rac GTPase-activating protein 1 isoform X1 [Ctenopharyngodon idella]|uniref:rac GTPase-activating protein 1 isoform X1 n=2 Tax=Ctenopharyngodon idella TaxID=7959 RepID=UPI00222FADEF|nr:rac GTPase-activating protein 1 isoform X1 [Ctenopharyngodon idella]